MSSNVIDSRSIRRKIFDYFQIAGMTATSKVDERTFLLGAVAIRNDGVLVKALNGPSRQPSRTAHAEARLSRKLDVGSTVYVARVAIGSGKFAMAKPCPSCEKALRGRGVKRVYYTTGPDEYYWLDL